MANFTFITASDIHISDTNPRSRIDNFKESILDKISQMAMACNKLGADGFILAGDLYNIKNPARNSHRLNQELIAAFQQFNCPVYMIEGNHDLTGNNLESLESQPLGVLFRDKTLIQLRHEILEKDGAKISLVGVPYTDDPDLEHLDIPPKDDCIAQICAMHIYASPTPGMLFSERIYGYRDFEHLSPDIFVFGHYHIDQGITEENDKCYVNIGAVSRGTLSEDSINHNPKIGLLKISNDDGEVSVNAQPLKLKVKPVSEVFDMEKKKEEQEEKKEIEAFVEKLVSDSSNVMDDKDGKIEDIIGGMVDKMDVAEAIRNKVMGFIEEAIAQR